MKHMEVHSYGRCLKNKEEPPRGTRSPNENKRLVISQYKWYVTVCALCALNDQLTAAHLLWGQVSCV